MAVPAPEDRQTPGPVATPPGRRESHPDDSAEIRVRFHLAALLKHGGGPLLAALASMVVAHVQHNAGKAEADKAVTIAYKTLKAPANDNSDEIAELKKAVAQLADTVQLQGKLLLAGRPGFTPAGKPEERAGAPRKHHKKLGLPPADPALVKKVQENATKNLEELKERAAAPAATAHVPDDLPKEIPPPAAK